MSPGNIASALLLLCPLTVRGLSLRFDLDTAARETPVAAWVQIDERSSLTGIGGRSCGVRYTGHVISAIKGTVDGERLTFGFYTGREVGQQFIVFLDYKPPVASAEGGAQLSKQQFLSECFGVLPGLIEVTEGLGTIAVDNSSSGSTVTLDHMYHVVPIGLVPPQMRVGRVYGGEFMGAVTIQATYLSNYLRLRAR